MSSTVLERSRGRKTIPVTPPRLDTHAIGVPESPLTATPVMTPKGGGLRNVASMPSLQSFNSVQSFQSNSDLQGFEDLDFAQLSNEAMYYDFDNLQTPELDPLSPAFFDMPSNTSNPHHSLLMPELSGSVGSGTSLSGGSQYGGSTSSIPPSLHYGQRASVMASNIEGLGIAEASSQGSFFNGHTGQTNGNVNQQSPGSSQWGSMPSIPSPENTARRAKQIGPPRVVKKPSKQALKQRKSRTKLNAEATASNPERSASPGGSSSTASARSSIVSLPLSPSKHQHQHHHGHTLSPKTLTSNSTLQTASNTSRPLSPPSAVATTGNNGLLSKVELDPKQRSSANNYADLTRVNAAAATPFHSGNDNSRIRGKAGASPAMQSPARPGQQPRLRQSEQRLPRVPAAAAATALFPPAAPMPDPTRQNSMAAAAAAAAASASHQQPVTPIADRHISRVSPTTLLLSNKAGVGSRDPGSASGDLSTIKAERYGTKGLNGVMPSPTPAARMHSSSKLVASASDSSPAKGVWSQAPRTVRPPVPLSQLPKPAQSPRKSASTSNMRRDSRRKQNKIIPEMSSSLNQFQVDLKPKAKQPRTSLPSASTNIHSPQIRTASDSSAMLAHAQFPQQTPQPGQLISNMFDLNAQQTHQLGQLTDKQEMAHSAFNLNTAAAPQRHSFPDENLQHGIERPGSGLLPNGMTNGMFASPPRNTAATVHPPMPTMPYSGNHSVGIDANLAGYTSTASEAPLKETARPASQGLNQVQPQGEPPQHVWASRPQPQKNTRRAAGPANIPDNFTANQFQRPVSSPPDAHKMQLQQQQQHLLEQHQRMLQNQHQQQVRTQQARQAQQQQQQHQQQQHHHQQQQQQHQQSLAQLQAQAQTQAQVQVQAQQHRQRQQLQQQRQQLLQQSRIQPPFQGAKNEALPSTRQSMPSLMPSQVDQAALAMPWDEGQDVSETSEFMAQFINDDWNADDIDLDAQWDLLETLETPLK